jgi:hypothetical protein
MRQLPATLTKGPRIGAGLDETSVKLQKICEEQGLARPITEFKGEAHIGVRPRVNDLAFNSSLSKLAPPP